jgi:hypothetical protein
MTCDILQRTVGVRHSCTRLSMTGVNAAPRRVPCYPGPGDAECDYCKFGGDPLSFPEKKRPRPRWRNSGTGVAVNKGRGDATEASC